MLGYSTQIYLNSIFASHFFRKCALHRYVFVLSSLAAAVISLATLCWLPMRAYQFRTSHWRNVKYFEVCTEAIISNRGVLTATVGVLSADYIHCVASLLSLFGLFRNTVSSRCWDLLDYWAIFTGFVRVRRQLELDLFNLHLIWKIDGKWKFAEIVRRPFGLLKEIACCLALVFVATFVESRLVPATSTGVYLFVHTCMMTLFHFACPFRAWTISPGVQVAGIQFLTLTLCTSLSLSDFIVIAKCFLDYK